MANCSGCGASNLGISRTNLVLVDGQWFCQNCLKKIKGKVVCAQCGNEAFESDEHFKTVDGKYLCTACLEKAGIIKKYDYIMQSVLSLKKAPSQTGDSTSQHRAQGATALGSMKDLLDQYLAPGETVNLALMGNAGEALALSNSHLYILKSGLAAGGINAKKCKQFRLNEIKDIELKEGSLYGLLEVKVPGFPSYDVKDINKAKQSDNAITFLMGRKSEFDNAVNTIKTYLH